MSEDVSRFLSQVKELGVRRIEEDEARSRELEEKILQDRKQRQARRAGKPPVSYPIRCRSALRSPAWMSTNHRPTQELASISPHS
ncbi:hypothetical protein F5Y18DRAFT_336862 [Xylariaceae sp. FL1019]|nr:hypothetical protein F5Y18DRAFT_336862 [Xylariaceae sp. FL1019]